MIYLWYNRDEPLLSGHQVTLIAAFIAFLIAGYFLHSGLEKSRWPVATAQVLSVDIRCEMTSTGYSRRASSRSVFVGCDQVAQFRRDNADRRWTMRRIYQGDVRVTRAGQSVTISLPLSESDIGSVPKVGMTFEMIQNPASSSEVSFTDRDLTEVLVGMFVGGFGVFMLLLAFFWF
ncbi:hypothetical protein [Devosia sp. 2618]|uniref:hypothetical protein n=1 Tax=Devosia sp. 2618 TaxID=3156454 RepID=UPI003398C2F4